MKPSDHSEFLAERYQLLVNSLEDYAIFMLTPEGVIETWNPGAEKIKGFRANEIIGQNFSKFYPPEDLKKGQPALDLEEAARAGRFEEKVWRLRKDGSRFWANVIITPLRDSRDGSLRGFAKITRDLTERKMHEYALRRSEESLSATLYSIGDAVIATDEQGHVTRINRVAERLTGWPQTEAIGQPLEKVFNIINEQDRKPAGNPVPRILEQGLIVELANHTALVARDGTEIPIADSGAPIRDLSGTVRGAVLVFRDVTEERRKEDALRKSEERFRVLVGQVRDYAIFMLEPDGRIASWNAGAQHLKGYRADEILGQHFSRFYPAEDIAADKPGRELEEAMQNGRVEDEGWRIRKDGSRFWANVVITALRDEHGRLQGFTKVTRDLTERREATERLVKEQVARAESEVATKRSAFLADLSTALAASLDANAAVQRIAKMALPMLGDYCIVDLRGPDGKLERLAVAHVDPSKENLLWELRRLQPPESYKSYPTLEVLRTRKPDVVTKITDEMLVAAARSPEYLEVLRRLHPTSHMVVPMIAGENPVGTISFVSTRPERQFNATDLALADDLAHRAALVIDNIRLYEREQVARRQSELLAKAGAILGSSLEYEATLEQVAALVVADLADGCFIHVPDEEGVIHNVAVAYADPLRVKGSRELWHRYTPHPSDLRGIPNVLRTGTSELYSNISEDLVVELAREPEHVRFLSGLGMTALLIIPLHVHGRTIGTLTLLSAKSRRQFGADDVVLAEELARRAAFAVENATLYRQSQRAVRVRDEFVSIASHELKTPLTSLKLHIQGLLRSAERSIPVAAERNLAKLKALADQVDRQERLVNDLLDFTRISAGGLQLQPEDVDLREIVTAVAERFEEQLAHEHCAFSLVAPGEPVVGNWDRLRIDQVVTNLLSNAIKYAPGKPIEIRVADDEEVASITVVDQGLGIAPRDQERIFKRFERAVSRRNYGGFGLGLWIVREITSRLGGSISVTSQPGRGSAFTVELPKQAAHDTLSNRETEEP